MTQNAVRIARMMVITLAFSLCGGPQLVLAQSAASPQQVPNQPPPDQQPAGQTDRGIVNPSQGPLAPVTPAQPPADQTAPAQPQNSTEAPPEAPAPQKGSEHPLGAAVGETGRTAGGPASRPAGTAIAPAKQRQTRSLFLKIGAIAAAGAAIGTVVALSRGTPSNPPGAR